MNEQFDNVTWQGITRDEVLNNPWRLKVVTGCILAIKEMGVDALTISHVGDEIEISGDNPDGIPMALICKADE